MGHRRHRFERDGIRGGLGRTGAPGERTVRHDEDRRHLERVEGEAVERLDDHVAGLALVVAVDLFGAEYPRDRDGSVEVVRVGRPETRNGSPRLRPRRRERRVRVDDAAERRISAIQRQVCRRV